MIIMALFGLLRAPAAGRLGCPSLLMRSVSKAVP